MKKSEIIIQKYPTWSYSAFTKPLETKEPDPTWRNKI
jgi:hypothetical protein